MAICDLHSNEIKDIDQGLLPLNNYSPGTLGWQSKYFEQIVSSIKYMNILELEISI